MEEDFIYDRETEYYLPDFFAKFKDKLPLLTIVISGYYGKTKYDDFADDTIVRFHTHHNVQRVIARESTEATKLRLEYLSIPMTSYHRFHRVHGRDRTGPEETMEEIVKDGFPSLVKFSLRTEPKILSKARSDMVLLDLFEETYLQGNTFIHGQICTGTVACILSPNISVTPITGMKGKSEAEFTEYLSYLNEYIKENSVFQHSDCDLTVKRFKMNEEGYEHRIKGGEYFPDTDTYSDPAVPPRKPVAALKDEYVYDYVDAQDLKREINHPPKAMKKMQSSEAKDDCARPKHKPFKVYTKELIDKAFSILHHHPHHNHVTEKSAANQSKKAAHDSTEEEMEDHDIYEVEDVDEGNLRKSKTSTNPVDQCDGENDIYEVPDDDPGRILHERTHRPESMSVEEVSTVLRQLRLDKYVDAFIGEAIDGALLFSLDESILKSEFKFSRSETKDLMKYITKGKIPK